MLESITIVHILFTISTGIMVFASILFFSYALISKNGKSSYLVFGSTSLIAAVFQFAVHLYATSSNIESMLFWNKVQSLSVSFFFPLFVLYVLQVSKHPKTKLIMTLTLIPSILFLIGKVFSESALQFSGDLNIVQILLPWGESIYALQGKAHAVYFLKSIFQLSIFAWIFWRGIQIVRNGQKLIGSIFAFATLAIFIASIIDTLIIRGSVHFIYTSGFVFCFYILLVCYKFLNDSYEFRLDLQTSLNKLNRNEEILFSVTQAMATSSNKNFHQNIVKNIYDAFHPDSVYISLFSNQQEARVIAAIVEGFSFPPFKYMIAETPCRDIQANQPCLIGENADLKYPDSKLLSDRKAKAFVGQAILNEQQEVIGTLMLLDTSRIEDLNFYGKTLEIYAKHISFEIQRMSTHEKLEKLAYTDYLTGLPNRAKFYNDLHLSLSQALETEENHTLFYLDLDQFKQINNFLGNEIADHLLIVLGHRFLNVQVTGLTSYRLTGDEFLYIHYPSGEKITPLEVAQTLQDTVCQTIVLGDHHIQINCSIGYVEYPLQVQSEDDILQYAETTLKEAKKRESGAICRFDPIVHENQTHKDELEEELRQALHQGDFELYIQPQVDENGLPYGGEFLIRWFHKTRGFISPAEFIPLAEEVGLIVELGTWVLEEAIKHISQWQNQNQIYPPHISINVSPKQFADEGFLDTISSFTKTYQVKPSNIVLELTETLLVTDQVSTIAKLSELRKLGYLIALDDFGTGYSSLAYLKDLPLDFIKIDKSFVDPLEFEANDGLVETIISMGRHMNLNVIAEGTETQEQIDKLKHYGCKLFQGYFYARPMPVDEFIRWVNQKLVLD